MKNQFAKFLTIPLYCSALMTPLVQASIECPSVSSYLGMDAQIRNFKWGTGKGDNLFKKTNPQGNFFGGFKVEDYFGFEAGYEITPSRISENKIPIGQNIANVNALDLFAGAAPPILMVSKFQIKGWHGDLLGYIPICEEFDIDLIGSVGLARLEAYHKIKVIADNEGNINQLLLLRTFKNEKTVLRLGAGGQQTFDDCYGIRVLCNWEKTSRFGQIKTLEDPTGPLRIAPKDSWSYGIGFFLKY